jgi:hypothetical protein
MDLFLCRKLKCQVLREWSDSVILSKSLNCKPSDFSFSNVYYLDLTIFFITKLRSWAEPCQKWLLIFANDCLVCDFEDFNFFDLEIFSNPWKRISPSRPVLLVEEKPMEVGTVGVYVAVIGNNKVTMNKKRELKCASPRYCADSSAWKHNSSDCHPLIRHLFESHFTDG